MGPWFSTIEWAAWTQALVALVALVFGPQALRAFWDRFYYNFEAVATPSDMTINAGANRWRIVISNRSSKMRTFKATIYPRVPENFIIYADVLTPDDGGILREAVTIDSGALLIDYSRFGPDRRIIFVMAFIKPDVPRFSADSGVIFNKINLRNERGLLITNGFSYTAHIRSMMFMVNYTIAIAIIIARLLYIGFFPVG